MRFLTIQARKIVYGLSLLVAAGIYLYVNNEYSGSELQRIRLVQFYAFAAVIYLYLALIASPLYQLFPRLPTRALHIRARRAIGVSTFFFALLHSQLALWTLLGGPLNLTLLGPNYLTPVIIGFTAFFILTVMASTSFDYMVARLGKWWKFLHRLVYLAAALVLVHALMLGTHFLDLSKAIPTIFFIMLSILLVLEAIRFEKFLIEKFTWFPKIGIVLTVTIGFLVYASSFMKTPQESTTSLGIHSQHVKLAQEAQTNSQGLPNLNSKIPGLDGDRTKRYSLDFEKPARIVAGRETTLKFQVTDASNGTPVSLFKSPYKETYHLIVVDQDLQFFSHLHPRQVGSSFEIVVVFPKDSIYKLYSDFQPFGGIEQQFAFTLQVGESPGKAALPTPDKNFTKAFGNYEVSMGTPGHLRASQMSLGQQKISFTIKEASSGKPVTNLQPYLNSFGHLVMINQTNYEYIHVHPYDLTPPAPNESGGPTVEFLPVSIYGAFKPGIYRAFAQFNHQGNLFIADFTVNVE